MKVYQLPDVLHEYLVHVIEKHAASGIHPEEGVAIARLWEAVTKQVTHIDDAQVKAMAAAGASPSDPEQEETNRVRAEAGGTLPPDHWKTNVHPEDR
jgi:hypothetical protein